jgi:hypothetical protein
LAHLAHTPSGFDGHYVISEPTQKGSVTAGSGTNIQCEPIGTVRQDIKKGRVDVFRA